MDRAERQVDLRPIGWVRRLLGQTGSDRRNVLAVTSQRGTQESQLQSLSLSLAACSDPVEALPDLLQPYENTLSLEHECRLLLAAKLPGHADVRLITTAHGELPTGLPAFLRYQFSGPLKALDARQPHAIPFPGSNLNLQLIKLNISELDAGLLLVSEYPLSGMSRHHMIEIASALSQGLGVWAKHQRRLEKAVSSERRAHAAELHDSLAQILGYLRLTTSRLDSRCSKCNQPELQALAADLSQQTKHAYRLMRDLISSSRLTLEGGSLHTALAAAVEEFEQRSGLVFELDDRCQNLEPDENTAIQLVMIVREALCNAVRHAHASHLRVQLLPSGPNALLLRIEDNGQGIDPSRKRRDSFGLGIMQERAARIGARLKIDNRPGGGTRLELTMDNKEP